MIIQSWGKLPPSLTNEIQENFLDLKKKKRERESFILICKKLHFYLNIIQYSASAFFVELVPVLTLLSDY